VPALCIAHAKKPTPKIEGKCDACGADYSNPQAAEVRAEVRKEARQAMRGKHPVSAVCPKCRGLQFKEVRPDCWVTFTNDRVCRDCDTRYTPPTPAWAAALFIFAGVFMAGFALIAVVAGLAQGNPLPIVCEGLLGLLGIMSIGHGIRTLMRQGKV
jgi:hypothetical protein